LREITPTHFGFTSLSGLRGAHLAYPLELLEAPRLSGRTRAVFFVITLKDGERVAIRPIRAEDEPVMRSSIRASANARCISAIFRSSTQLAHRAQRLTRIRFIDMHVKSHS
jgi:hypothetical protein